MRQILHEASRAGLALVAAVAALPLLAALDGTMSGVVKDDSGQPLPGASVTVSGPYLQGTRTAVTRGDGTFLLPNCRPAELQGRLRPLRVHERRADRPEGSVGLDTQVNATMRLSAVTSEVVVTGEAPVVDITRTNTQESFTVEYLRT